MADALCGPSNPLQNLQKHTLVDRTLQQDRLVSSRQSPSQGFRTADPRAGSLDADFHAFEKSTPSPFQFQQPEFSGAFSPQQHAPAVAPGGWASDFQRLSIQSSPIPAGQFRTEAPLIKTAGLGGWQNEFMRQRSGSGTPVSLGKQAARDAPALSTYQTSMNYPQPMFQSYTNGFHQQPMMQPAEMSMEQHVQMSDVDFEAAFSEALAHAQEMDQHRSTPDVLQSPMIDPQETFRIGSDALNYVEKTDRTEETDTRDADELARTAGELLSNVSHDQSDKFQNSQFLQLMRKIRDREVEVQDNDLRNTATSQPVTEVPQTTVPTQSSADISSHFSFPDMDTVYAPTNTDTAWSGDDAYAEEAYQPKNVNPGGGMMPSPWTTYGFEDDQYPTTQVEALHPGGKLYPEQSPRLNRAEMEMSGAVADESAGMARRFVRDPEMGSF